MGKEALDYLFKALHPLQDREGVVMPLSKKRMAERKKQDRMSNLVKPNYVGIFGGDDVPLPFVKPSEPKPYPIGWMYPDGRCRLDDMTAEEKGIARVIEAETKGGYLEYWDEYRGLLSLEQQSDYFLGIANLVERSMMGNKKIIIENVRGRWVVDKSTTTFLEKTTGYGDGALMELEIANHKSLCCHPNNPGTCPHRGIKGAL